MANGIVDHAEETTVDRRSGSLVDLGTQSAGLQITGRDQEIKGIGRTAGAFDNDEHKRFVREVHEEVNQAREQASELKLRRQEQAETRREKLRQAYLRKLLEKQKAASNAEQT